MWDNETYQTFVPYMRPKKIKRPRAVKLRYSFNVRDLQRIEPNGTDQWIHDPATRGLSLKVTASGRKVFVLRYRTESNRQRKLTLGSFPEMTVAVAREAAVRHWSQIFSGGDPAQGRADKKTIKVAELVEIYLKDDAKPKLSPATYKRYEAVLRKKVVPSLGAVPLADLTRSDIECLHRSMAATPVNANRMLAVFKAMLNKAEDWDLLPKRSNPAARIKMNKEKRRIRYFTDDEQAKIFSAIEHLRPKMPKSENGFDAIMLLFYTGCRPGEVLRLRWEDIDLSGRTAALHMTKTGEARLPLSNSAVNLLQSIAAQRTGAWVFPGADPDRHLTSLVRPWKRICEVAQLSNARLHDIRHTVATYIAASGNLYSAQVILRHTTPAMTTRYAHPFDVAVRHDLNEAINKIEHNHQHATGRKSTPKRTIRRRKTRTSK
ncbi:tyrosine-type recombinase/integrase [Mameliella sp.]|uniref:tyrosine-type recombinase/integrase n=1 Tax=Mameliella sp. TaxID=1924940 RepID=UPI003B5015B1